jgi:hypothetical protein
LVCGSNCASSAEKKYKKEAKKGGDKNCKKNCGGDKDCEKGCKNAEKVSSMTVSGLSTTSMLTYNVALHALPCDNDNRMQRRRLKKVVRVNTRNVTKNASRRLRSSTLTLLIKWR